MSVGFLRAVAEGCRARGVVVSFESGAESRGNGQRFPDGKPSGLLLHHTGSNYGTGLMVLIQGRPDLSPPLCNSCGYPDGRIHFIAAHPANHAGASGGKAMGPFPVTRTFNRLVWGHEIMYPGTHPMTPQQHHSAIVLSAVICELLGYPDADYVRAHFEISITGKWDIGRGSGTRSLDMTVFRALVAEAMHGGADSVHVAEEDDEVQQFIIKEPGGFPLTGRIALGCPTGDLSASKRLAWLSVTALDLHAAAEVEVFVQGDRSGLEQWKWTERELTARADNYLPRACRVIPPNASHILVRWDFSRCPEGATLTLETRSTV